MSESTAISWTDHTWSPVWGCTEVSKAETGGGGCDNCYARVLANRFGTGWNGAPMREFGEHHWNEPLRWNRRAAAAGRRMRVFPSMCDPFDKNWPLGLRTRFFKLILSTPHLTWLLLTKRIGNVAGMVCDTQMEIARESGEAWGSGSAHSWDTLPENVWLGATVVNQEEAYRDIPKLLAVPARIRFLSIEPMLGPMDIVPYIHCDIGNAIEWVIVGGESGRHARPLHIDWVRSIVQQSIAAGVAVHVKQLGKRVHDSGMSSPGQHWPSGTHRVEQWRETEADPAFLVELQHVKGGDLAEWPEDLRVQEFPA